MAQHVLELSAKMYPNYFHRFTSYTPVPLESFPPDQMPPLLSGNSRAGTRAGGEGARTGRPGAAASPEEVSEPNLLSFGHDLKFNFG